MSNTTQLMLILFFRTQQLAPPHSYCLLCFIFVKSKHFPKDQSAANLSLLHLSRLFRASLQKVLSFKIPQKDIGWTRKVTMNFSYIFYGISSHKKSFLTAFYLIFILDFFISRANSVKCCFQNTKIFLILEKSQNFSLPSRILF